MAQGFNRDAEFDRARAEIARLLTPGVLGFYTHFEATEIFAVRDDERVPFNIFSILSGLASRQERADPAGHPRVWATLDRTHRVMNRVASRSAGPNPAGPRGVR